MILSELIFLPIFLPSIPVVGIRRTGERTLGGREREMGKWRKRYWTRSRYPLKQNSGINKKKKGTFMHGQLHFRAANSDLRGSAGVLRLLLFNRGGRIVRLISSGFPTTFRKKRTSAGNKYYYKSVHS